MPPAPSSAPIRYRPPSTLPATRLPPRGGRGMTASPCRAVGAELSGTATTSAQAEQVWRCRVIPSRSTPDVSPARNLASVSSPGHAASPLIRGQFYSPREGAQRSRNGGRVRFGSVSELARIYRAAARRAERAGREPAELEAKLAAL